MIVRTCSTCCYWLPEADDHPACAKHYTDPARPRAKTLDDVVTLHWRAEDACEEWTEEPGRRAEWAQMELVIT